MKLHEILWTKLWQIDYKFHSIKTLREKHCYHLKQVSNKSNYCTGVFDMQCHYEKSHNRDLLHSKGHTAAHIFIYIHFIFNCFHSLHVHTCMSTDIYNWNASLMYLDTIIMYIRTIVEMITLISSDYICQRFPYYTFLSMFFYYMWPGMRKYGLFAHKIWNFLDFEGS